MTIIKTITLNLHLRMMHDSDIYETIYTEPHSHAKVTLNLV